MEKKESYRNNLPHFQLPGQAYFVTWNLKDAVPKKALISYTQKLEMLKSQLNGLVNFDSSYSPNGKLKTTTSIEKLKKEYYLVRKKYIKAYDDLLDLNSFPTVDLSKIINQEIISESLFFWEGEKLTNYAFAIMPNHVHWVFGLMEKDEKGELIYLQDLLQSIKRFTANQINLAEKITGSLWQKESFDTTIRNNRHLYYAIRYTLNNPVKAGLVSDWRKWKGAWSNGWVT